MYPSQELRWLKFGFPRAFILGKVSMFVEHMMTHLVRALALEM